MVVNKQSNTPYFIVNVEAAIRKDDKWLMCIRSQKESHAGGMLSLIGGKVEYTDSSQATLEKAIEREILEEIGLVVNPIDYVQSSSFLSKLGNHIVDIVFSCDVVGGELNIKNSDELSELHWMSMDEIRNHPKAADWLISCMNKINRFRNKNKMM